MKKILLIPTTLVAITSPIIILVGCKDNDNKEYELTIVDDDSHIHVETTKFKLNQDIVVHYACDPQYFIDEKASIITIGGVLYHVSDFLYDRSTVTIPADKVNSKNIGINFKAIYLGYDLIIEDVDSNVHVEPTQFKLHEDLTINYSVENDYYLDIDSEVVNINGVKYPIKDFTYNANSIIIPGDKVNTDKISVGLKTKQIPIDKSFADDSWSTVCGYANEGINKLYEVYNYECATNYEYPGTLIGLERTVEINGHKHEVAVVGQNQDYQDNQKQNPVALTFQFFTVPSDANCSGIHIKWGDKNENYWDSNLWNSLENEDNDGSIYNLIKNGNNDNLHEKIKSVFRTVNTKQDGQWVPTINSTKLFAPSLSSYFSHEGLMNTDDDLIDDSLVDKYCAEGEQYQYFGKETKIGDTPIKYSDSEELNSFECLIFRHIDNTLGVCWICSPKLASGDAWYVDGRIANMDSFSPSGYIPFLCCFCI